jgi:hypothetical protein
MQRRGDKMRPRKAWHHWLESPVPGAQIYYGVLVRQFGLETVRTKMRLRDLALRTGGEPALLAKRHKELIKQDGEKRFRTLEDQTAELNDLLQRSFTGGKKSNVAKIGDPEVGYLARVEKDPDLAAFFPEFAVVHPDPAYLQPIPVDLFGKQVEVGLVAIHLYGPMTILDGQTRLQGAIHYAKATGSDWILDEEVSVCVIPGIPAEKAKQVFVTVNSTPIPVSFEDLIDKDEFTRAYKLTKYLIEQGNLKRDGESIVGGGRGSIRRKAVYQFVMQTLLGSQGEAKNADYLLEKYDLAEQKETLSQVLSALQEALGGRWADTNQLLVGGYGLAAAGRVYYETMQRKDGTQPSISFAEAMERIKGMEWHVNDERWLETGVTATSRRDPAMHVSKLTSFDMIRRIVDIITRPDWEKYKRLTREHTNPAEHKGALAVDAAGTLYRSVNNEWVSLTAAADARAETVKRMLEELQQRTTATYEEVNKLPVGSMQRFQLESDYLAWAAKQGKAIERVLVNKK